MITFIAVDFFELVDLEQYELPLDILNIDPEKVDNVDILNIITTSTILLP